MEAWLLLIVTGKFGWDGAQNGNPAVDEAGSAHQLDEIPFDAQLLFHKRGDRLQVATQDVDPDAIGAGEGKARGPLALPGFGNFSVLDAIANDDALSDLMRRLWLKDKGICLVLAFCQL